MPRISRTRLHPLAVVACIALTAGLASCGSDDTSDEAEVDASTDPGGLYPVTIDDCGREVELSQPPEQVMTLGASPVGLLHSAGAADVIAARSGEYGTTLEGPAGEAVADVPIVDDGDPTREVIVGAQPDLVIGYGFYETTAEDLAEAGIPSILTKASCSVVNPDAPAPTVAHVYDDIELYGELFGTEDVATEAVASMRSRVDEAVALADEIPFTTAAALYLTGGELGAHGNRHLTHDVLGLFGLENTFGDLDSGYAEPSIEALLDRDPDLIVLTYGWFDDESFDGARAEFEALPGVADLTAVSEDRVFGLHYSQAEPQPEVIGGIEQLATWITGLS